MRLPSCSLLVGLGVLPSLALSGCLGDDEGPGAPGGLAGSGGQGLGGAAGAGAGIGGTAGESSTGVGGTTGGATSSPNSGGAPPDPPDPPDPPELPKVVTSGESPCSITLTRAEISPHIGTVGHLEFETTWHEADSASVEFGKGGTYGLTAPVTWSSETGQALVLGMTTTSVYHYRIVLRQGDLVCRSDDLTLITGPMPNGTSIGNAKIEAGTSSLPSSPGYVIASNYNGNWVYILNEQGELVWYFETTITNISSVRLAPDGRHVYARTLNVGRNPANGRLVRIAIDGSSEESVNLTSSHHDFDFGPDGSIVYIRKSAENSCDSLYLHDPAHESDSEDELVADLDSFFTVEGPNMMLGGETCHTNSVHYREGEGYTASDLVHNAYVKMDELGQLEWILGGGVDSSFSGDGSIWARQHGHQLLAPGRLLFFNNQTAAEKTSRALEVVLDFDAGEATYAPFEYSVEGLTSQVLGDVRRLPNGNTLVTYSVGSGHLHEVDQYGELVRVLDLPGGPCGYTDFRESLYAQPEAP